MKKRKKIKFKNKLFFITILFISIIFCSMKFIKYLSDKVVPIITEYAESETKKLTILVINKAITKQINNIDSSNVFDVVYNDKGEIILIDFNTKNSSEILSIITGLVELNLRAIEEGKIDMLELPQNSLDAYDMDLLEKGIIVEVPMGIATGSNLLYNLGPKIPVKLSFIGDVVTGFSTEVQEYGINNALIKLLVDIEVDTKIILPINSKNINIKCSIPIAIKLIQGKVPSYYGDGFITRSNVNSTG